MVRRAYTQRLGDRQPQVLRICLWRALRLAGEIVPGFGRPLREV
jgi:hypothetical protein